MRITTINDIKKGDIAFIEEDGLVRIEKIVTELKNIERKVNKGIFSIPKYEVVAQQEEITEIWFRPLHDNCGLMYRRGYADKFYNWKQAKVIAIKILRQAELYFEEQKKKELNNCNQETK